MNQDRSKSIITSIKRSNEQEYPKNLGRSKSGQSLRSISGAWSLWQGLKMTRKNENISFSYLPLQKCYCLNDSAAVICVGCKSTGGNHV